MTDMSHQLARLVYDDLIAGLVDLRDDASSTRFDAELDTAVDNGTLSAETAHRLRCWQRASVRAVEEHVRTVVPSALAELDASRRDAQLAVDRMALMLGADSQLLITPPGETCEASAARPAGDAGDPDDPDDPDEAGASGGLGGRATTSPPAEDDAPPVDERERALGEGEPAEPGSDADTPGRASAAIDPSAASLGQSPHRLIVADLVSVMPDVRKD